MKVQSLSVSIPAVCPNNCKFCISRMRGANQIKQNLREPEQIMFRLQYARDEGATTMVITSTGEPLTNLEYIKSIININRTIRTPFHKIELQTSGSSLERNFQEIKSLGIQTISLSVADIFDQERNNELMGMDTNTSKLCQIIKEAGFNLRISLNMVKPSKHPKEYFDQLSQLGANQVTFRYLFATESDPPTEMEKITREIRIEKPSLRLMEDVISTNGTALEKLPFGVTRYSYRGISTVIDEDCMNKSAKNQLKYLILKPNNKLYTKWDDDASLVF